MRTIFNQMITQSRFKKVGQLADCSMKRDGLTLSKSMGRRSPMWLSGADRLVLGVLEVMNGFGFPVDVVRQALVGGGLDCVASTFRLLSIGLAEKER